MTSTTVRLAHTVHARDHRTDTRCPLCREHGPVPVPEVTTRTAS